MGEFTRTRHSRQCPKCEGAGEEIVNTTNPHGYGPDPQCDEPVMCIECGGTGTVTIWRDPLVLMKVNRKVHKFAYQRARARATAYSAGLAQADMLASMTQVETAFDNARAALRRAA